MKSIILMMITMMMINRVIVHQPSVCCCQWTKPKTTPTRTKINDSFDTTVTAFTQQPIRSSSSRNFRNVASHPSTAVRLLQLLRTHNRNININNNMKQVHHLYCNRKQQQPRLFLYNCNTNHYRRSYYHSVTSRHYQTVWNQRIGFNGLSSHNDDRTTSTTLDSGRKQSLTTKTTFSNNDDDRNQQHFRKTRQEPTASEQVVKDMLERIRDCNNVPEQILKESIPFIVNNIQYGIVRPKIAHLLCSIHVEIPIRNDTTTNDHSIVSSYKGPIFTIQMPNTKNDNNNNIENSNILLEPSKSFLTLVSNEDGVGTTYETRTMAVNAVMMILKERHIVTGWRNELLPIKSTFYDRYPLFAMERSAVPLLGAIEYGVHVNGIVHVPVADTDTNHDNTNDKAVVLYETKMWLARRSLTKSKYPGMVDHIVAGGQPVGISLYDNVIKECMEEAGISEQFITSNDASLIPVSAISYTSYNPIKDYIQRAVLFNYDLTLPLDFIPTPVDGEVDEFFQWTISQLYESMSMSYHDPIKPNCYLVIIDFLIRHGYVTPDTPGYLDLIVELRSGQCQ